VEPSRFGGGTRDGQDHQKYSLHLVKSGVPFTHGEDDGAGTAGLT
jgi:hypothetical protein